MDQRALRLEYIIQVGQQTGRGPFNMEPWHRHWGRPTRTPRSKRQARGPEAKMRPG
jgi:hypothetical protein